MHWLQYSAGYAWQALRQPQSKTRRGLRWVRRLFLALLLPLLLLASAAHWWLLPHLHEYRADVAKILSDTLQLPVSIEQLSATLDGGRLALRLRGVQVYPALDAPALAQIEQAAVVLQMWRSLREQRLVIQHIRMTGVSLYVDAQRWQHRRPPTATAASNTLFTLPNLDVIGERLSLRLPNGAELPLLHPYLQVRKLAAQPPQITFNATLPRALGERLELRITPDADHAWQLRGSIQHKSYQTAFHVMPSAQGWQAEMQTLRIEQLLAWAVPWLSKDSAALLNAVQPQGSIATASVEAAAGEYAIRATFQGLRTTASAGYLGLHNLSGSLQASTQHGELILDSRQVKVESAGVFRAPIWLDRVQGALTWQRADQQWRVQSSGLEIANADGRARAWGELRLAADAPAWLDFQVKYQDIKVSAARHYLPVSVIPAAGVAWLDRALVSGKVTSGEMLWRGSAADFPFDQNQGLFETRFQVTDAILDYQAGWPRLERLNANVHFRNRGLLVEAQHGRVLDGVLEAATARIDDLSEVVVQVKGRAKGAANSMWEALKNSPWGAQRSDLPTLQASGNSSLQLELTLPTDQRPNQIRGAVTLLENNLDFPTQNLAAQRVRGVVRFTEDHLEGNQLSAYWRGEPLTLDFGLVSVDQEPRLRFQMQGKFALATLLGATAPALPATGKSLWKAQLTVPVGQQHNLQQAPFSLTLSSDLRGSALALPPPFAKNASEAKALTLQIQPVAAQRFSVDVSYAHHANAVLVLQHTPNAWQLERGELRIDAGKAQLPETPGLSVLAELPRFEWTPPKAAPRPVQSCARVAQPSALLNMVQRLTIRIGQLQLAGQRFDALHINASREAQGLRVQVDGAQLAGEINLPDRPSNEQPLTVNLKQLTLRSAPTATAPTLSDPCAWPELLFTVDNLQFNQHVLGSLRVQALPEAAGVNFTNIELQSKQQSVNGSATWQWRGAAPVSQMSAHLHSPVLAETLSAFGYPGASINGAETDAQFSLASPGSPADFALEKVQGDLDLHIGRGQLLDIQPGLGRMIGLFSLESLARRLRLDFSDLLQPGTSFDQITGNLLFANGQAEVEQLRIEAPAAKIEMQGQIDLVQQQLDQQVTITPRLGIALPVAGTIAGGPLGGAAGLLAERVLRKNIEKAISYQYRLHGAWDNPQLEALHIETGTAWDEPNHNQ